MNSAIFNYIREVNLPLLEKVKTDVQLRRFSIEDVAIIYNWRNHISIRQQSLTMTPISFNDHYAWCEKKLHSKSTLFLMAEKQNILIGTVRYELENRNATVNIYLAPEVQGRGLGRSVLLKSIEYIQDLKIADKLLAQVKETNVASIKLFEYCGFIKKIKG